MERPLKEHIAFLEQRVQELQSDINRNLLTKVELDRLDSEIEAAELALTYYRKAFDLERQLV